MSKGSHRSTERTCAGNTFSVGMGRIMFKPRIHPILARLRDSNKRSQRPVDGPMPFTTDASTMTPPVPVQMLGEAHFAAFNRRPIHSTTLTVTAFPSAR